MTHSSVQRLIGLCVLALASLLGAWGAMATVTGGLLLAAGLAALLAALRTRRMMRSIADRQAEP